MSNYLFPRVQAVFFATLILMCTWTFDRLAERDFTRRSQLAAVIVLLCVHNWNVFHDKRWQMDDDSQWLVTKLIFMPWAIFFPFVNKSSPFSIGRWSQNYGSSSLLP